MLSEKILAKGVLDIAFKDVQSLDKDQYALARKDYFGASDSSILCGVNLYKNMDQLIQEKNAKYITKEEQEVGEKPIVKKGYDLEPIILDKAAKEIDAVIYKPDDMFYFKNVKGLSVNYDGILIKDEEQNILIPVEAKLVSKYGEKYYNKLITHEEADKIDIKYELNTDLEMHIKRKALKFGIPAYYYTQVQQEIAGLDAPYGYLAAMFDDSWTFKLYLIKRDDYVINKIYDRCINNIDKIERDTNK